jgi:hypothetical protein
VDFFTRRESVADHIQFQGSRLQPRAGDHGKKLLTNRHWYSSDMAVVAAGKN